MGQKGVKDYTKKETKYLLDQLAKKPIEQMNEENFAYFANDLNAFFWKDVKMLPRDSKSVKRKLYRLSTTMHKPVAKPDSGQNLKRGTIDHVMYLTKQLNHTVAELTTTLYTFCENYKYEHTLLVSLKEVREAIEKVKLPKP
jgi:hypothetical protein